MCEYYLYKTGREGPSTYVCVMLWFLGASCTSFFLCRSHGIPPDTGRRPDPDLFVAVLALSLSVNTSIYIYICVSVGCSLSVYSYRFLIRSAQHTNTRRYVSDPHRLLSLLFCAVFYRSAGGAAPTTTPHQPTDSSVAVLFGLHPVRAAPRMRLAVRPRVSAAAAVEVAASSLGGGERGRQPCYAR